MSIINTYKVLKPSGILTASTSNANELKQELQNCLENGIKIVLINLQEVNFIDSSGLGVLVSNHNKLRLGGGKLYFCCLNDQVRNLFDIADVDSIFTIFNNQAEFTSMVVDKNQAVLVQ